MCWKSARRVTRLDLDPFPVGKMTRCSEKKLSHPKASSSRTLGIPSVLTFQQYQIRIFLSLSLRSEHNRYDILLMLSLNVSISICVGRDERRLFYLLKDLFHRFIGRKFEWKDHWQQSWILIDLKVISSASLLHITSRLSKLLQVSYADTKDVTFSAIYF